MALKQETEEMYDRELSLGGRAAKQYAMLSSVLRKDFVIDGLPAALVFNPGRVHSVMADVSPEVLAHRQCFLCPEGLEDKQQTLAWGNYFVRVNPFPIFPHHFTVSSNRHEPQRIAGHYADMLDLAKLLPDYTVFYNGPHCGASAPDHMHFQMVPEGSLPMQRWCDEHYAVSDYASSATTSDAIHHPLPFCPSAFLICNADKAAMERVLFSLIDLFCKDFNIVTWHKNGEYRSLIYFRSKSRPDCFYAEKEDERILFSPAAVEMSGIGVVSSEDAFRKIDGPTLARLIREVSYPVELP